MSSTLMPANGRFAAVASPAGVASHLRWENDRGVVDLKRLALNSLDERQSDIAGGSSEREDYTAQNGDFDSATEHKHIPYL